MMDFWKQWEGQVVDSTFPLRACLGGSEAAGVFLTELAGPSPQRAAIKLIRAGTVDAEGQLSRWRTAAGLSHPNLLGLTHSGRCRLGDADLLYVVMEYAEENLSQVIPERALTEAEARQTLEPVVDALAWLHARGFVHGRLKPSNIMATGDRLKISTDGISQASQSPAGDIWSLGMVVVESLMQRRPKWDAADWGDPVLPEGIPAPFLEIARNCLRRDAQSRWTASQVGACLRGEAPAPTAQPVAKAHTGIPKWGYGIAAAAVVFLALMAAPALLHRAENPSISSPVEDSVSPAPPVWETVKEPVRPVPPPAQVPEPIPDPPKPAPAKPAPAEPPPVANADPPKQAPTPGIIEQVMPDVPAKARRTIRGTVRTAIRVNVNASGKVTDAEIESLGPSQYFADLALRAARQWQFAPAKPEDGDASRAWILRFAFTRARTTVTPRRVAP